ncbi:hypothetical protein PIB30_069420 [Stylosanthes scabra]|uniref:Anoctamin transmembrane domain-containing protein n=1 Tax=Stylosanthes scabra TaxID=79078 RepID=A0ABU6ZLW6_9FABA|nr:hypothetical protein [Stylosanthes scabra]
MNNEDSEGELVFEICVVIPKRDAGLHRDDDFDCGNVFAMELQHAGLVVERVVGNSDEFFKVAAPLETLGRAAAELRLMKRTHIGMDLQFDMMEVDAFVKQPDDDKIRKNLLKTWALQWWDFTTQPVDEIFAYYGPKIAIYFAFLGMYTQWLLFPSFIGLIVYFIDYGSANLVVLPTFFIVVILWAIMFSQFWKRKNAALLARWPITYGNAVDEGYKVIGMKGNAQPQQNPMDLIKLLEVDRVKGKKVFTKYEWFNHLLRIRNDALVIVSIICLQLPFELAYAHLYEVLTTDIIKFALTAIYLATIQYITKLGGKVSVKLIMIEHNESPETRADSLVYKVFGLYFMQTYIGIFYHALLHRNFGTLRKVLIQRLLISEVVQNLIETSLPYINYNYKKYAVRQNKEKEKGSAGTFQFTARVEKEFLKASYTASTGEELEDGLFDDFLELALQFGMILMFACAFPPAFAMSALNNIMEIRTDALKLLAMLRRPVPRASATVGAWLNIFQFLILMSICTNCALLAWLFDEEGKWKIEPGLVVILIMEHVLLLIKFGFSRLVPAEPAWVRAARAKNSSQARDMYTKRLLRTISGGEKTREMKKID